VRRVAHLEEETIETVPWLVCDYGDVISLPQTPEEIEAIAALSGRELDDFLADYWAVRADYDRGDIDAWQFWSGVVAGELTPARLERLHTADNASWTKLNGAAMAAIEAIAARGYRLALLSNAPADIARYLDAHPWFQRFEHRVFSCDLQLTKPDPAIFAALVSRLDCEPADAVFVDDRAVNVAAAKAFGIRAIEYRGLDDFALI
jgi:putative hydrolase of the HAD superfamily